VIGERVDHLPGPSPILPGHIKLEGLLEDLPGLAGLGWHGTAAAGPCDGELLMLGLFGELGAVDLDAGADLGE
jgi:hypothetical protein